MNMTRFERRLVARRIGKHALVALTAIVTIAWVRYAIGVQDPGDVPIPVSAMPTVNAFDDYQRAGERVRADKDAIALYFKDEKKREVEAPQLAALLERHRGTLATVRAGFGKPCQMPTVRRFDQLVPYYTDFRTLGQLLVLEGRKKEKQGDIAGAASSYRDAVRFGADISQGGPLIGHLVSLAVGTMGRQRLWHILPHMDARTAKETAAFLESVADRQSPIADAFVEEKYGGQTALLTIFRAPTRALAFAQDMGMGQASQMRLLPLIYMRWSKREIMANYTGYLDKVIAQARAPYSKAAPDLEPRSTDPLTAILTPVFSQAHFTYTRARTDHALLTVACARQAYCLDKGGIVLIDHLEELVNQGYLEHLPDDPFAAGESFHYEDFYGCDIEGMTYHLYSVGPDGKDDGGGAIDNEKRRDRTVVGHRDRNAVFADSEGDMVAGINH
jgi:hypothetical protein